jgi:hypothetical protein
MLDRYAFNFATIAAEMVQLEKMWRNSMPASGMMTERPDNPQDVTFGQMRIDDTVACLARLTEACKGMRLDQVVPEIRRLRVSLDFPFTENLDQALRHLRDRIRDELASEYFLHVNRADVVLYGASPFGEAVTKKFAKATDDIEEAGKCLAVQRPTACVFHLMRAMEIGVRVLGRKLKVSINVEVESWAKISDHIDGAIKLLPTNTTPRKRRKAELALVSANLSAVRIAQRNDVMHPKATYTQDQARNVYSTTSAFLAHLAGLV